MNTMHLFAGIGGGLLADLILGHKPIVAVEWDKYACRVLRERVADGWFPDLSVWEGDVRLFDPSEYAGRVDCIHAGFPCQDISVAGKQAGLGEGTRSGLYREVLRIVRVVNEIRGKHGLPAVKLFLENVSAILSNGLGCVLGDLAEMGYDCRWLCIRASDVGAPHGRDRWFALAQLADATSKQNNKERETCEFRRDGMGRDKQATQPDNREASNVRISGLCRSSGDAELADTIGKRQPRQRKPICSCDKAQSGKRQTGHVVYVRERSERQIKSSLGGVADGILDELVSGWWEQEPNVGRVTNISTDRVGQLKGLGNAQVPLQAAAAWRLLTSHMND